MSKIPVTFTISLPVRIEKKEEYFVACCPVLDIWSQGETHNKTQANIKEAIQLFFTSCYERGTLFQVLKDSGFSVSKKTLQPKAIKGFEQMDIPLPFVIDEHLNRCHA